jgi:hypothetical protein
MIKEHTKQKYYVLMVLPQKKRSLDIRKKTLLYPLSISYPMK